MNQLKLKYFPDYEPYTLHGVASPSPRKHLLGFHGPRRRTSYHMVGMTKNMGTGILSIFRRKSPVASTPLIAFHETRRRLRNIKTSLGWDYAINIPPHTPMKSNVEHTINKQIQAEARCNPPEFSTQDIFLQPPQQQTNNSQITTTTES